MLSPAKALIAGTIVFAVGGAFLLAQPFDRSGPDIPAAATAELAAPVAFTASLSPSGDTGEEECQSVDGISQCKGLVFKLFIANVSDPRLDGKMTASHDRDGYPDGHWFDTFTYRVENDDGAWQGSTRTLWYAGDFGANSVVLVGEGAYAGLYAWVDMSDWSNVTGVIFPMPPPEEPLAQRGDPAT